MRRFGLVVALVAAGALSVVGGFSWGYLAHRDQIFPYGAALGLWYGQGLADAPGVQGRWRLRDGTRPWLFVDGEAFTQEQLRALGYAEGTVKASDQVGVVRNLDGAAPGLNLVTSGHAPEAILMDLDGRTVHTWSKPFDQAFPELAKGGASPRPYWRRARLLPDGGLVTMFVDQGVVRLDVDSGVVWTWQGGAHHDLQVHGSELWLLSRQLRARPALDSREVIDDEVVVLDLATGAELRRFALYDAVAQSSFKPLLRHVAHRADRDYFHSNALRLLDGAHASKIPAFKAGNILISLRNLDLVMVVDPSTVSVVWAMTGPWSRQHEPSLLPSGNLLVFDNMGSWPRSRALEVDPVTQEVMWAFDGGRTPLISETCGTAHRLPNGNTLIVASDTGRAVEVTRNAQIVWEYYNPARAGDQRELVATLFDVQRLHGGGLGVFAPSSPSDEPPVDDPPADVVE